MWQKLLVVSIYKPAFAFAFWFTRENQFDLVAAHTSVQKNATAQQYMVQRYMHQVAAAMVRCVRDNGRWISVAKFLKPLCPNLYKILVHNPRLATKVNEKNFDFRLKRLNPKKTTAEDVATNIPVAAALILFMYLQDRKDFIFVTGEKEMREVGNDMEDIDHDVEEEKFDDPTKKTPTNIPRDVTYDKGYFFSVKNALRTHLLTLQKAGATPTQKPGFVWSVTSKDDGYKFGKCVNGFNWTETEPLFRLPGMLNWVPLDSLLHMVCSGGFRHMHEECEYFTDYPKINLLEAPKEELYGQGNVGRQIYAVRKLWQNADSSLQAIKKMVKPKKNQPPYRDEAGINDRLQKLLNGTYSNAELKKILSSNEDDEEEEEDGGRSIKVDGLFSKGMMSKKSVPAMEALAQQCELLKNRTLLHLAALSGNSEDNKLWKYDPNQDFNNEACTSKNKGNWNAEGPLLQKLTRDNVATQVECFKKLLQSMGKSLEDEQKTDYHPDDIKGKKFETIHFEICIIDLSNSLLPKIEIFNLDYYFTRKMCHWEHQR